MCHFPIRENLKNVCMILQLANKPLNLSLQFLIIIDLKRLVCSSAFQFTVVTIVIFFILPFNMKKKHSKKS